MRYEIYIDVVFFTNLLIDYILLRFIGTLFKCAGNRKRAFAGAVLSYIMEEFVRAEVNSYDAIIDGSGNPIFEAGNAPSKPLHPRI